MDIAIQVDHLEKSYGTNQVLKKISFQVKKGEIFALLGINGAGKTTALECIEGIRKYDCGEISINGKCGVQLQSSSLPQEIKAIEALRYFAKWQHISIDEKDLYQIGMKPLLNKQYGQMSTGQKRRLHLALALLGNPDILFLDEPTAGLDVEGRVELHQEIKALKRLGKTIILASHDMAEVEELCDRIAILREGEIAFLGTSKELTETMNHEYNLNMILSKVIDLNKYQLDCSYTQEENSYLFKTCHIERTLSQILPILINEKTEIQDIKVEQETLEQRFLKIVKEDIL